MLLSMLKIKRRQHRARRFSTEIKMLIGKRLTILGAGMMGKALAGGLVRAEAASADSITFYDIHGDKAFQAASSLPSPHGKSSRTAVEAVLDADIVLLAVKPRIIPSILGEIASSLTPRHLVISIAAGVQTVTMEALLGRNIPVIRAMPNTPSLVGEGATAIAAGIHANAEHTAQAAFLFSAVSRTVIVDENLMDAVTGLSGSGPAYVYMMIEALMDGGVKAGLTRDTARLLAAQTVYGAAKMVLESEDHPAQLKDNVTTPGGTTIQALAVLERAGFRTAIIDAIEAAAARSKELS
jgi:pyrroline-5-carboxylate reductase